LEIIKKFLYVEQLTRNVMFASATPLGYLVKEWKCHHRSLTMLLLMLTRSLYACKA